MVADLVPGQEATAKGTAQAGTDYPAASGQVTFAPGQTSKTLPVKTREIV